MTIKALIAFILLPVLPISGQFVIDSYRFSGPATPAGAPAWGTYGTSTGEILFAWDGSSASGSSVGYDDSEAEVSGTLTGATIGGSGVDSYVEMDADDDRLTFVHAINTSNAITVCMEVQIAANASNQHIFEITESSANYFAGTIRGAETLRLSWRASSSTTNGGNTSGSITDDGATYNNVMFASRIDAGTDMSASSNGATYDVRQDNDILAFSGAATTIYIGNFNLIGSTTVTRIKRFAVLAGFEQAIPW